MLKFFISFFVIDRESGRGVDVQVIWEGKKIKNHPYEYIYFKAKMINVNVL